MSSMILTVTDILEGKIREVLAAEGATADQGCSALANLLLRALVKAKKEHGNPQAVADEMRRLAAKLVELSALEGDTLDRGLSDVTKHSRRDDMRTSDTIEALAAALSTAQGKFTTPKRDHVARIETRTGGTYSYKYSTLENLRQATQEQLTAEGLSMVQEARTTEQGKVALTTRLMHKSGQWIEFDPLVMGRGDTPQDIGAVITYACRYAKGAALNVATEDDNDAQEQTTPKPARTQAQTPQEPRTTQAPTGTTPPAPSAPQGVLTVLRVAVVSGDKGGKPWTRYDVFLSDDRKASTFDRKVWERAEQLKGCPVIVDVVPGKNGRGLNLEMIADAPKAQPPEPDVPDEPVAGPEAVMTVRKLATAHGDRWEIQTAKRRLLTAQEGHATEAVAARKAKLGIVPAFDVVQTADGRTFNKLTGFVVETPAEREPGEEG